MRSRQTLPDLTIPNREREMWQPDIKIETMTYPAGGVAPSTYALALHSHTYPAGGVAPLSYALALHNYVQKIRIRQRET